jgi:HEAT repeat protein
MNDKLTPDRADTPSDRGMPAKVRRLLDLKDGINAVPEIVALGPAAVPFLEQLLRGPAESIFEPRCLVAETIGMIGGERAVEALLRALEDSLHRQLDPAREYAELAVINRIAETLGKLKADRAREPLLRTLMQHPYPGVIRGLSELDEQRAIPWIVPALSDDFAREASMEAIRKFGGRAVPALMVFLDEGTAVATQTGRAAAARLLAELGAREAVDSLRRALDDPSATVRLGAAVALSGFPQRQEAAEAIPVLLEFLADENPHRAEESMSALMNLRSFSETALIRLVHAHASDDAETRTIQRAVVLLEKMASWRALEAIASLHARPEEHLRFRALQVLTGMRRPDVAPLIAQFLHDAHPLLMNIAVESLQQKKMTGAYELIRALPTAGAPLRRRILSALKALGPEAAPAIETFGTTSGHRARSAGDEWLARRLKRIRTRRRGKKT